MYPPTLAIENTVIIGSGPAGYTAAIYAARANLKPFVLSGFQDGGIPGGQLMTTTEVENFPGFPSGISGPELMNLMEKQARRWGAEIICEDVIAVDFEQHPFIVRTQQREVKTHTIIIATGATAKRLGLPNEEKFWNAGISACAICDGATPIFRNEELIIIGGGDTAAEEAIYLTKYGSHVHLLVRRNTLRASKAMQDRLFNNKKITVHWNTEAIEPYGNETMQGLRVRNNQDDTEKNIAARGLFYAIGHKPNTDIFNGKINLDEMGYIVSKPGTVETNIAGVFAAGDVKDHEFRQAITAAGTGCMAAMLAERWLSEKGLAQEIQPATGDDCSDTDEAPIVYSTEFDPEANHHHGSHALRELFNSTKKLIVVKYASPNCGPCKMLQPVLQSISDEFNDAFHFVEINIEEDFELAGAAGVTATPTVQFFKDQAQVGELKGVKQRSEYIDLVDKFI